jgi:hypothetical protein
MPIALLTGNPPYKNSTNKYTRGLDLGRQDVKYREIIIPPPIISLQDL